MLLSIFCGEFIDPKVLNVFVYIFFMNIKVHL